MASKSKILEVRPWSEWRLGDFIVGRLIKFGNDRYCRRLAHIKIVEVNWKYVRHQHKLKNRTIKVGPFHPGMWALDIVERGPKRGTLIRIIFSGKRVIEKGILKGKSYYQVDVDEVAFLNEKKHRKEMNEIARKLDGIVPGNNGYSRRQTRLINSLNDRFEEILEEIHGN